MPAQADDLPESVTEEEQEDTLPEEVADGEYLERFLTKNDYSQGAKLKWQALRLRAKDRGGLSIARLAIGADACKVAGKEERGSTWRGFAETTAERMRGAGHDPKKTGGGFEGHGEVFLAGLKPDWPIPAGHEPDNPSDEKVEEIDYYRALIPHFTVILEREESLEDANWRGPALGTS